MIARLAQALVQGQEVIPYSVDIQSMDRFTCQHVRISVRNLLRKCSLMSMQYTCGLILSASRQLEESLPPGPPQLLPGATSLGVPAVGGAPAGGGGVVPEAAAGGFRRRVDTIWDDVRVQKEWTQVSIQCT